MSANWKSLAETLTDEDFELLLRHRIAHQFDTVQPLTDEVFIHFTIQWTPRKSTTPGKWSLTVYAGFGVSNKTEVQGEILGRCVGEMKRRTEYDKANVLKLITGGKAPS